MNLERANRILVVRGYKYHNRYLLSLVLLVLQSPPYLLDGLEASASGHLDIEEQHVDMLGVRLDAKEGDNFVTIPAFTDDLDVRIASELEAQAFPGKRLILCDQCANFHRDTGS